MLLPRRRLRGLLPVCCHSTSADDESKGPSLVNNFINGEFVPASSGEYLDVINPATNEVCGRVTLSNSAVRTNCVSRVTVNFRKRQ